MTVTVPLAISDGRGGLIVYLGTALNPRGWWEYTYSITPGVRTVLVVPCGPATLPPDHPAVVAAVRSIKEASYGYTGPGS